VGAFALEAGAKDAALLFSSLASTYTAHVSAPANATGIALVEVYEVRDPGDGVAGWVHHGSCVVIGKLPSVRLATGGTALG
jgi:hypothetical protein